MNKHYQESSRYHAPENWLNMISVSSYIFLKWNSKKHSLFGTITQKRASKDMPIVFNLFYLTI